MPYCGLVDRQWDLQIGDEIRRTELHKTFGGRNQGGVGPSAQSRNVLIFSDPASGEQHGYRDGWADDGTFHYTGEGQRGDQQFRQGNRAIRDHQPEGRALRVFKGASGTVTYVGQFELPERDPWYYDDAPETGDGPLRQVIIFRLVPINGIDSTGTPTLASGPGRGEVRIAELEQHHTDTFERSPNNELLQGSRREQPLLLRYAEYLRSAGHVVGQHQYWPQDRGRALRCDAFDETSRTLIESKSSCGREAVRMAIGQLLDYARFERPPVVQLALLVPERPRPDLLELLRGVGIHVVYPDGDAWTAVGADLEAGSEVLQKSS